MNVELKENPSLKLGLLEALFSGKEPDMGKIRGLADRTVSVEYAFWAPWIDDTSTDLLIKLQVGDYKYCARKRFGRCDGLAYDAIFSAACAQSYLDNLQEVLGQL